MTPVSPPSVTDGPVDSTGRRVARSLAFVIAAAYAFLALVVLEPESLFSIDAAIKLLQAQSLRDSGFASVAIPYPAHGLDPELRFVPFAPPLVFVQNGALQGVYPTSVALLNAVALSVGFPGLVWLSVGSALVVLLALVRHTRGAVPAVVLLGAGTPFWAYGVLPWEHMPALACSTVAVVLLEKRMAGAAYAAAALVGIAITMRGESALLVPGLAVLYFRGVGWRHCAGALVSLVMPLVAMAAVDVMVFGRPAFSHVSHAVDLIWTWFGAGNAALRPESVPLLVRVETIVGYWIFGLPHGVGIGTAAILLVVAGTRMSRQWRLQLVLVVLVCVTVLLARDLLEFALAPDFVAGLLRVSPVLLFAVLPPGSQTPPSTTRRAEQVALFIFICGLLASSRHAGAQVGPQFMLPIFPCSRRWRGKECGAIAVKRGANRPSASSDTWASGYSADPWRCRRWWPYPLWCT